MDDHPIVELSVLFQGLDRTAVRQLAATRRATISAVSRSSIVDTSADPSSARNFCSASATRSSLFQPLALADVAHQALPSPVREDLRADLGGHEAAVLPAQRPLVDLGVALEQLLPLLREPIDLLGPDQIDDRLAEDLLARVAEHPAAGAVDVGVAAGEVGDEHRVGRLLEEGPRPRAARFEVLVGAVQGDRGAAEHEQADHGHRGRQHRNHDRERLTADGRATGT